jgi:hypothetical protein
MLNYYLTDNWGTMKDMSTSSSPPSFSEELQKWLKSRGDKTLRGLILLFEEKAFAIIFLLMLALPALPIPTGGITHVTELVAALVALQLIAGRRTIWLPRWATQHVHIGKMMSGKAGAKLIAVIKWFERRSHQRWDSVLKMRLVLSLIGLVVLVLTTAAFVAPPFSGLDTLPALGVVTISLGLILEDVVVLLIGVLLGALGIGLEVAAGTALYSGFRHFF